MSTILHKADQLVGDVRVESVLSAWRISGYELELVEIAKINVDEESQVRDGANRAPKAMVDEYAMQMGAGAAFPPIVVDRQGWRLLDGNTRKAAATSVGLTHLPAYTVRCNDDDVRRGLAAALNQTGGKRLDEDDAMRAAETMERLGMTDEQIALYIGRSSASVKNYRADRRYLETARLATIDETVTAALPRKVRRKLATVTHVEPFRSIVSLAAAGVRGDALDQAVTAATSARSDEDAVNAVELLRAELAPQAPPPAGRARINTGSRATSTLRKLLDQSVDLNVPVLAEHEGSAAVWREGAKRLAAIVGELDEIAKTQT